MHENFDNLNIDGEKFGAKQKIWQDKIGWL